VKYFYNVTGPDGREALIPHDNVSFFDTPSKKQRQEKPEHRTTVILKMPSIEAPIQDEPDQVRAAIAHHDWSKPIIDLTSPFRPLVRLNLDELAPFKAAGPAGPLWDEE
jgi:hypothetical protein